ncbi:MAG: transposase [Cyclobacteriaceae bacterium]
MKSMYPSSRKSSLQLNEVYFWTATVKDWKKLLSQDKYKRLIINTWKEFTLKGLIKVYGFVIMPNHLHVIWELLLLNGKEKPHASFTKKTAHEIVKDLKAHHPKVLPYFEVTDKERAHRIWQRDSLGVLMDSKEKLEQKLDYIHANPLQERWNLVTRTEDYPWSSASFYELGDSAFDFITDYRERF